MQVDEIAYGDTSACQVVQLLDVEQELVVLPRPTEVTVAQLVTVVTGGVLQ